MSKYTTGELAKLCDVSVRTVQYYDSKNLLNPTEHTEGGRRLYSEGDLNKLKMICLLKTLGLSLDSIKGILQSKEQSKVLLTLLEEQLKQVETEIKEKQSQKKSIKLMKESIQNTVAIPINSISDIEKTMKGKKKLKKIYGIMITVGIIMDIILIGGIVLWISKELWQVFAIGISSVIIMGILLVRMYYRGTAYICPECNTKFKPTMANFFFSKHTPKTRKLKCTNCGYDGYCIETFSE